MLNSDGNEKRPKKQYVAFICTCSTLFCTFLCRCFARHNVTARNFLNPSYTFYEGNVICVPIRFVSSPLIFTLVAASISYFFITAIKVSCFSSKENPSSLFFIARSSCFSVIQVSVDNKIKSKKQERKSALLLFFL